MLEEHFNLESNFQDYQAQWQSGGCSPAEQIHAPSQSQSQVEASRTITCIEHSLPQYKKKRETEREKVNK